MTPYSVNPAVTVAEVNIIRVAMPFSAARRDVESAESIDKYNASSREFTMMESLMVKVTTSDGKVGWGEAFGHASNDVVQSALENIVVPFYLGRTIDPVGASVQAQRAFHAFGRTGPVMYAVSALDMALWDLAAQYEGKTLRDLVADQRPRDDVRAYASLVHYSELPEEVTYHLSRAQDQGYESFKLHESSREAIAAARKFLGDEAPLMVDVNCRWTREDAVHAAQGLVDLNLAWLEEPVWPPDDVQGLRAVSDTGMPVAVGENASGPVDLVSICKLQAVQVIQPSVGKVGGITAMLEIFAAVQETNVQIHPHCFYYGPAVTATAQLTALLPSEIELEMPFLQWPEKLHDLHTTGPVVALPLEPGLGFKPDEDVLRRHTISNILITS